MALDSSGKTIVRKALHSSHLASKSANISSLVKTVSNKVMYKPVQFKTNRDQSFSSENTEDMINIEPSLAPPPVSWNPLPNSDEQELIPVLVVDFIHDQDTANEETLSIENAQNFSDVDSPPFNSLLVANNQVPEALSNPSQHHSPTPSSRESNSRNCNLRKPRSFGLATSFIRRQKT